MDKKKDILSLVNNIMSDTEKEEAIKDFIKEVPGIVTMHRSIYDEMKKQKYNEEQSFKFASDYILGIMLIAIQNRNGDTK